jgi:hypothetical protein
MGKKDKKDKKHKGIEKTAIKTEKNLEKKTKKLLKEKGEVSLETQAWRCMKLLFRALRLFRPTHQSVKGTPADCSPSVTQGSGCLWLGLVCRPVRVSYRPAHRRHFVSTVCAASVGDSEQTEQ